MQQNENKNRLSWLIVFYKLISGLVETVSGLGIALFGKQIMAGYTFQVTKELAEEPHDLLARISEGIVPNLFAHNTYLILTLVIIGLAKIAGAIGLVYKENWGVDLLVGLTVVILPFQIVNLTRHWSVFSLLYMIVGVVIALYLIQFKPKAWISRVAEHLARLV